MPLYGATLLCLIMMTCYDATLLHHLAVPLYTPTLFPLIALYAALHARIELRCTLETVVKLSRVIGRCAVLFLEHLYDEICRMQRMCWVCLFERIVLQLLLVCC